MKKIPFSYSGNKGRNTIAPQIINLFRPHSIYIELCLGSGGIMRWKSPAKYSIGVEIDYSMVLAATSVCPSGTVIVNDCAISWARSLSSAGADVLIYADPPYVKSSRRSSVDIYNYEWSDEDHIEFLSALKSTRAGVVISGYDGPLYSEILENWQRFTFPVSVHGKIAHEVVWCNYHASYQQEYTYLGKNKTDRQRIKRKIQRWCSKLRSLPLPEREAIYNYLQSTRSQLYLRDHADTSIYHSG